MIEPNLDSPEVLRRTLEGIERQLLAIDTPIAALETIDTAVALQADLTELGDKLNEMIGTINMISSILNSTRKNQF